ncbi:MAG: tRNA lysidine(34) synthetase TilS [Caldisericum sp.]
MEEILEKVLNTIKKYELIRRREKILLAVSGGIDSMTMLYILHKLRNILEIEIGVATFDHGIRRESAEEIKIVEEFSKKLNVPFFYGKGNALELHLEKKQNLEDVARSQRFNFLREVKDKNGFSKIALAHNKNDFVETFLMHLFKGSGLSGLTSMLNKDGDLIRPLIEVKREEIETYARNENIPYVVDLTNYNLSYERNRLRYQIIPLIMSSYKNFVDHIFNVSDIMFYDNNILEKINKIELKGIKKSENEYSIALFKALHLSIKRRILKKLLEENANFERINMVIEFLNSNKKRMNIGKDLYISKTKDSFYFERAFPFTIDKSYILEVPGETLIPEARLKIITEIVDIDKGLDGFNLNDKNIAIFDFSAIKFPIFVRFRKEGDTIEIENGKKKLQDLFVDLKIRRDIRYKIPIVVDNDNKILWVCGLRRSTRARIEKDTKKALCLRAVLIKENL